MTKPTNWRVRTGTTQISLGIRPVWLESSLCAQWVAKDPIFLHADREDSDQTGRMPRLIYSDQTGRMPRLIWVFAGRTVILLVLSCDGSNESCHELKFPWWFSVSDPSNAHAPLTPSRVNSPVPWRSSKYHAFQWFTSGFKNLILFSIYMYYIVLKCVFISPKYML